MAHLLFVSGARACFARREFAADRISYDVVPPIAARGIFESIHWTPSIRWHVEMIEILHPIQTEWIAGISPDLDSGRIGRGGRSNVLTDVAYLIQARFELTDAAGPRDSPAQHSAMFRRRIRAQRFFRRPYLGRRDFAASIALVDPLDRPTSCYSGTGAIDLGWMIYDLCPDVPGLMRYYRPLMRDGVIDVAAIDASSLPT